MVVLFMLVIKTDIQNSLCKNLWISYINQLNKRFDAGFIQLSDVDFLLWTFKKKLQIFHYIMHHLHI